MAEYISVLTGAQMDSSLLDMAQHTSEAWAVGERNGIPVEEGDPTYHNNAKYWADNAHESYYTVTYNGTTGDRTFSEILTAYNNGNMIILRYLTDTYYLNYADNYYIEFTSVTVSGTGNGAVYLFDIIRVTSLDAWIHLTEKFAPNGVANVYSASSTYAVGDYVLYNGLLYECTTAITTAESWTAAHWTRVSLADDVSDLKNALGYTAISPIRGGYIATSGTTTDYTVVGNNSYLYAVVDCTGGDIFTISGKGASAARLWAFVDENGNILSKALANATETGLFVCAPADAVKLVINTQTNVESYNGWVPVNLAFKELNTRVEAVEELIPKNYVTGSFKNDMTSEKGKIPGLLCYKNGVAEDDNYGQEAVRYVIPFAPYNKLHIAFDFKYSAAVPYVSDTERFGLFYAQSGKVTLYEQFRKAASANGYVQRNVYYGYRIGTGSATNISNFVGAKFNGLNGENAFWVQYTGNGTSAFIRPQDNSVLLYESGVLSATITYNGTDSVDSLIAAINNVSGFSAGYVKTAGKQCSELMLYSGDTIQLCYDITLYGSSVTTTDKPKVYIPYAKNEEWHTFECCIDESDLKMYYAIDGNTSSITLATANIQSGVRSVQIGGTFNGAESLITVRNLQVDFDSYGDAEIITNDVWDYATNKQLISERSPKVLIFEGHGVDVCKESDAPITDDMAASTDRLRVLFSTLKDRGYCNISYQDLIAWKINGKKIPKRSFVVMMDDYRVDNYVDLAQRQPFVEANVTAGLAIITDRFAEDATWTFNDTTYTRRECFDMILRGGWYPCSHTRNHRHFTSVLPSATEEQLKQDVISADKLNVYSDIMVYPYGEFTAAYIPAMQSSDFKVGINIVKNQYNCKAINNFYLSRVEMGTRCPLPDLLAQIP